MIGRSWTDTADESAGASDTDTPPDLSLDDIYHLLQTKRRRDVLRYLRDAEGPVRLRELAEQIAAWEQGTTVEHLRSSDRQRVYISLYQSHLPKLDNHGIVDYDKDRGRVEPTPLTSQLDSYLGRPTETPSPGRWPRRYAVATALWAIGLVAIATGGASIPGLAAAGGILLTFAILTGVHAWSTGSFRR
ncbi:DUF7344 domain-containing protein [Natrinema salaciae]|uniref:DUF7344 domain-containing protein n=1 Tax=Natrinema salaciae TaxID=1186196 RepID=A0A1H9BMG1_9EURY|nr:hypothetical protein [Natrinema salaciae]SEP90069.1 hypothetical protein SAMN04489841_0795 [Natrinema salaciae]